MQVAFLGKLSLCEAQSEPLFADAEAEVAEKVDIVAVHT